MTHHSATGPDTGTGTGTVVEPQRVHDLGRGLLGTALRHSVHARRGGDWTVAHAALRAAAATPFVTGSSAGLFHGAPALAFILNAADHPAYRRAGDRLAPMLDELIGSRLDTAERRLRTREPARLSEFDLISGLTGLGALLLTDRRSPDLLDRVLRYLVRLLTEPVEVDGIELPGWWSSDTPAGVPAQTPADGHANFGMAHGVSGPIALLALSHRAGHDVPDLREALDHACRMLRRWATPLNTTPRNTVPLNTALPPTSAPSSTASPVIGAFWPETVDGVHAWRQPPRRPPGRPSWCYGTPGVARAMQLAAIVCHDPHARRVAEDALGACATDPAQLALLTDDTICHGTAGLHLAVARATADAEPGSTLRRLPTRSGPPTPPGPADPAPSLREVLPRTPDRAGLLTGADGVHLAHGSRDPAGTAGGAPPVAWDLCLLLDGNNTR